MNPSDFLHVDTSNLNKDICDKMYKKVKFKQKHSMKSTLDKIEDELSDDTTKLGRKPKSIDNTYCDYFNKCVDLDKLRLMNRDVEDVIVGVSRLNWYRPTGVSIPLSVKKIIYLFKELNVFNNKNVGETLGLGITQARIYTRACGLIVYHLDRLGELPYDLIDEDYDDDLW